jgi:predicted PurR-regulated permease PerM
LCFSRGFLWRLLIFAGIALLLVYVGKIVLVAFAGILLAILLRALADWLQRITSLSARWSYTIVLCAILLIAVGLSYVVGPRLVTEAYQIAETIPQAITNIENNLNRYTWGRDLTGLFTKAPQTPQIAHQVGAYASKLVEAITDIVVILAVALFLGSNPPLYCRGFLQLLPEKNRHQGAALLNDLGSSVRGWLLGQLIPMTALGVGSLVGLWIMGIPLALTLSLFTALMLFVPYLGSVTAYIPTALVALTQSPMKMVYVTVLYLGIHIAEGYVITPLAQRRAVRLPPALTLIAQLFMWTVAGVLGVLVATPLAAVGLVVVQKLYLKRPPVNP